MGVTTPARPKCLDISNATLARPDLPTFTGLDDRGLRALGQYLLPDRAVLACRVGELVPG